MKKYTDEFKRQSLEYLYSHDISITDVAKNMDIPVKTFEKWVANFRKDKNTYAPGYETLEAENKRLKYTIKKLRETIEILKKAKAFSLLTEGEY